MSQLSHNQSKCHLLSANACICGYYKDVQCLFTHSHPARPQNWPTTRRAKRSILSSVAFSRISPVHKHALAAALRSGSHLQASHLASGSVTRRLAPALRYNATTFESNERFACSAQAPLNGVTWSRFELRVGGNGKGENAPTWRTG